MKNAHILSESKIFVSEAKKKCLEKIKKNILKNPSEKFIFTENYTYKIKKLMVFYLKINWDEMNLPKNLIYWEIFKSVMRRLLQLLLSEILINSKSKN